MPRVKKVIEEKPAIKMPKIGSFASVDWTKVTQEEVDGYCNLDGHPAVGSRLFTIYSINFNQNEPWMELHTVPMSAKDGVFSIFMPFKFIKPVTHRQVRVIKKQAEWFKTARIRRKTETEHPYTKIFQ